MPPLTIVKLSDLHQTIYNYIENNKVVISEYEDMKECILKMIRDKYIFNMNRDRLRDAMEDITYMLSPDDEINKDRVEKGLEYEYSEDEIADSDEEDNCGMDMAGLSEIQRLLQSQIVNAAKEVNDDDTEEDDDEDDEDDDGDDDGDDDECDEVVEESSIEEVTVEEAPAEEEPAEEAPAEEAPAEEAPVEEAPAEEVPAEEAPAEEAVAEEEPTEEEPTEEDSGMTPRPDGQASDDKENKEETKGSE